MSFDTRRWLVATIAGFVCLGVWLASVAGAIAIDPAVQALLLAIAIGSLGLSQWTSYKAVNVVDTIVNYDPDNEMS